MQLDYAFGYVGRLFLDPTMIVKLPIAISVGIIEYLLPQQINRDMVIALGMMIIIDLITGISAAWQSNKKITSIAFSRTLTKFVGYGAVLCVTALLVKNFSMFSDMTQATLTSVLTLMMLTEAVSVLENVNAMGIKLPFGLSERLKSKLQDMRSNNDGNGE